MPVSRIMGLAAANDLDGVQDNTKSFDVTGASRVIIETRNDGTAGTAGVDVVAISKDAGTTWSPVTDLLAIDANDSTGTVEAGGVLNVAGTAAYALFKCGPYEGPTALRIFRKTGDIAGAVTWVTGAPSVRGFVIGGDHAGGAPSTTLR